MFDSNMQESPDRPQNSETKAHVAYSRMKRKILRHVWLIRIFLVVLIIGTIGLFGFGILKISKNLGVGNIFSLASSFLPGSESLISSNIGHTNILIMGKAGGAHDGPDLTDTMILVSISLTQPKITTVSIPRDLWIPDIRAKINSAYYWGNQKSSNGGISFAKSVTEKAIGVPVHYGVVIDFSAFKDVVDALGGVQVNVVNSFTDKLYPIAGRENDNCGADRTFSCRYEAITFNIGLQSMDGTTALKFVRSRHAEGDEGTDQAREARQQKVIEAIKNKMLSPKVFLSPKIDFAMIDIVKKYIQTDIDKQTASILARIVIKSKNSVNQYLIPGDLLINPPIDKTYDNQYVLIPKLGNGKWSEIQTWFKNLL